MGTCLSSASSAAESNPRLFLRLTVTFALLLVVMLPSSSSQVPSNRQALSSGCQLQQLQQHRPRHWQTHTTRECQLFSSCSRRHVRILGEQVDAKGIEHEPTAVLLLVATADGRLRLQRRYSNLFACFNQSGHLVAKDSSYLAEWNDRCSFRECLSDNRFMELRSVANHDWMVGFNKFGDPLRGKRPGKAAMLADGKDEQKQLPKLAKCYQLLKRHCPSRALRAVTHATTTTQLPSMPDEELLESPVSGAQVPP